MSPPTLGLLVLLSSATQEDGAKHQSRQDLRRWFCYPGGEYLEKAETRTLMFSWDWDEVTLIANDRSEPQDPTRQIRRVVKVPVFLTAVAPRYYDSLYLVGVRD